MNAFEAKPESGRMMKANADLLVRAFEEGGLQFIPANGGGAGIRFRDPPPVTMSAPRRPKPEFDSELERAAAQGDPDAIRELAEKEDEARDRAARSGGRSIYRPDK